MAICVVVVVVDDGPTRLPLLAVAASNNGVVVVVMERDGDCVTDDDSVTRPFTPDVKDAFDVLADCVGLSDNRYTHSLTVH